MQLRAEFTSEPFEGEGEPPAHATEALRAAEHAGLVCDFGPFGTAVSGDGPALMSALPDIIGAAFIHGANRVTFQVERLDD